MPLGRRLNKVASRRQHHTTLIRLVRASLLLLIIFVTGTLGYYFIGGGYTTHPDWNYLLRCAYMAVITLTTVGYGEVIVIEGDPVGEIFTIILIVLGMGTFLYFVSALTAFVVEGEFGALLWRRRMSAKIAGYEDHFIIAGVGNTGQYVVPEMLTSQRQCVIVDRDVEAVELLLEHIDRDIPFIEGDATDDDVLQKAGIERASGVVFSLGNDRDNLFAVITARRINPDIRIVTRGEDPRSEQKFRMAGATSVIYTNVLGGMRMAAEIIRPEVTTFLDLMMQDHGHYRRVEELPVPSTSPLVGRSLRDLGIRRFSDALVVAVYTSSDDDYHFNPGPDFVIPGDSKLIVLARVDDVAAIENLIQQG